MNGTDIDVDGTGEGLSFGAGDDAITIDGSDIEVRRSEDDDSLEIDGNRVEINDLELCAEAGDGSSAGSSTAIPSIEDRPAGLMTAAGSGSVFCDGASVTVEGENLDVEVTGACGRVTVLGSANHVIIGDAEIVALTGDTHRVEVELIGHSAQAPPPTAPRRRAPRGAARPGQRPLERGPGNVPQLGSKVMQALLPGIQPTPTASRRARLTTSSSRSPEDNVSDHQRAPGCGLSAEGSGKSLSIAGAGPTVAWWRRS